MVMRNLSRKVIAITCLLIFCLAIYGTAFGSIGCHCVGQGFQSVECNKAHPPHDIPHYDAAGTNLCVCDQLACRLLDSRSRAKRQMSQMVSVPQFLPSDISPSSPVIFSGRHNRASLALSTQSLQHLRTVVLLH